MRLRLSLIALLLAGPAFGQVTDREALATMKVGKGLHVDLFASEPMFVNPTCIDVDHKGRVWVCESKNYRYTIRGKKGKDGKRLMNDPEGDRLVVLTDADADGKADRATTFYQSPDFLAPLGVAVAPYPDGVGCKVFVCHSPHIYVFEDKDGDLKADGKPKVFLTGFEGYDHDHGVHGILIGPDNKLYFSVGDRGVKNLQSADGKGRKWTSNQTDCRAGTIWKCDLDGTNLELIAHNFRNQYEPAVDSFGNIFVSDNDDDGNQQTRICFVMPGGDYGYHPRGPGESHWHEAQPGVVPKILRTGFGSPTGMCVYEGTLLPERFRGMPLHTDAGPREVRCYHLKRDGAGFKVDSEVMLTSGDNWCRFSDVCVAPDGSVIVADWNDPGVGGHGMGDLTRGRIYRLTPKGHTGYKIPKVNLSNREGILDAVASPNLAVRHMGLTALAKTMKREGLQSNLGREGFFVGTKPAGDADKRDREAFLKARTAWLEGRGLGKADSRFADRLMIQRIRLAAPQELLKLDYAKLSPAARREVLLALRNVDPAKAKAAIYKLAKLYDGRDRFYLNAIGIAVGRHDEKRRKAILADFAGQFPEWNARVSDLVFELQPPSVLPRLEKLLSEPGLPAGQRAQVVNILAASRDPEAGRTMLRLLTSSESAAVRQAVLENLVKALPGKWRELRGSKELGGAIKALFGEETRRVEALSLIAAAGRGDWQGQTRKVALNGKADPAVRLAAVRALGTIKNMRSVEALAKTARSADRQLAAASMEALGEQIPRWSARSRLARSALKALQDIFLDAKAATAVRQDALRVLAAGRAGGDWLVGLKRQNKLPADLEPKAAQLLRYAANRHVRDAALAVFPEPNKLDIAKLPPLKELAKRRGNLERGRSLMAASLRAESRCMSCHTVRGVGGKIGPGLSTIGVKGSREDLYKSIIYPSQAVADQYVNWQVATADGQLLSGLIVAEDENQIVLRDANGKDYQLGVRDIVSRSKLADSVMPNDIVKTLTEEDLTDIVEYLASLKTPALSLPAWRVAGPFAGGPDAKFAPEKSPASINPKAVFDGKGGPAKWRAVSPDGEGYLDLQRLHAGRGDGTVTYLFGEFESPKAQVGKVLLGADEGFVLWVNGRRAAARESGRGVAVPGSAEVPVTLAKGRNTVMLKVANTAGAHGLYFAVLTGEPLKADATLAAAGD